MELKEKLKKGSQGREEGGLYKEHPYKYAEVIVGFLTKDNTLWGQIWHCDHSDDAGEKKLQQAI